MSNDGGKLEKIYTGIDFIYRLMILNLLWIVFTLLGGGLFGFGPSTIALFDVTRKWIQKEEGNDKELFFRYLSAFKKNFLVGNIAGFGIGLIFYMLLVNYRYTNLRGELLYTVINVATMFFFFIFLIVLAYLIPLYVHYEMDWKNYFGKAFVLSYLQPLPTALLVFWIGLIGYLTFTLFPFSLLLCFSGMAYGVMGICYSSFIRNEMMLENKEEEKTQVKKVYERYGGKEENKE